MIAVNACHSGTCQAAWTLSQCFIQKYASGHLYGLWKQFSHTQSLVDPFMLSQSSPKRQPQCKFSAIIESKLLMEVKLTIHRRIEGHMVHARPFSDTHLSIRTNSSHATKFLMVGMLTSDHSQIERRGLLHG